jgi:hypothetical protein
VIDLLVGAFPDPDNPSAIFWHQTAIYHRLAAKVVCIEKKNEVQTYGMRPLPAL